MRHEGSPCETGRPVVNAVVFEVPGGDFGNAAQTGGLLFRSDTRRGPFHLARRRFSYSFATVLLVVPVDS